MQTADIIEFPTLDALDPEELHVRAATMDVLAELVEGVAADRYIAIDAGLAEELRSVADVLLQLSDSDELDVAAVRTQLTRSADLVRRASVPLCHSSARRMFGGPLYERVRPAVMTLGDLSTFAYERSLDANPDALVEQLPIRRFGRVAAQAYDWAQWNADAPAHLREPLIDAITEADAHARDTTHRDDELAPVDAAPLTSALESLLDAWLVDAPGDVLADFAAERDPNPLFGDCFDIGVACSIARRLLVTAGAALPDTADIHEWLAATLKTVGESADL